MGIRKIHYNDIIVIKEELNIMEKIIPHQRKDITLFVSVLLPLAIILYLFGISIKPIIGMLISATIMFILKFLYDQIYHSRIKIGEQGLSFSSLFNNKIVRWEDLTIEVKALNKDQKRFIMREKNHKISSITIFYLNESSFMHLIKQYCPKNHELFRYTEEYAKEKNLPF